MISGSLYYSVINLHTFWHSNLPSEDNACDSLLQREDSGKSCKDQSRDGIRGVRKCVVAATVRKQRIVNAGVRLSKILCQGAMLPVFRGSLLTG